MLALRWPLAWDSLRQLSTSLIAVPLTASARACTPICRRAAAVSTHRTSYSTDCAILVGWHSTALRLQCFDTVGWASGRASGLWWGDGVVICLEWGADCLHMVQLMPLPSPSPIWYRLTQVVLEKRPLNTCSSSSSLSSRFWSLYIVHDAARSSGAGDRYRSISVAGTRAAASCTSPLSIERTDRLADRRTLYRYVDAYH